MLNILLMGPMGVGKSTIAAALTEQGYQRYSFADPIKHVVQSTFPWVLGKAEQRSYFQKVGAFLRRFQPNPLLIHAEMALSDAPLVIDDGRTVEEAVWAHNRHMLVVVLDAPPEVRMQRLFDRDGALPDVRTLYDETETEYGQVQALRLDTSLFTAQEIVAKILAKAGA